MEPSKESGIEDVYLNVFPLFKKPSYATDARFSLYIESFINYLASTFITKLPGLDPLFVTSLRISWQNTSEIYRNANNSLKDVCAKTKRALNSLSERNFIVLHFPYHSCDIVVFADKDSAGHLLFVPMELRRTKFSSVYPVEEDGFARTWRIALPKAIFRVEKARITDNWLRYMADLQLNEFSGAYPLGKNRASQLPDSRKPPTPTYIIEWLLPGLSKETILVDTSLTALKTVGSLKNFVGTGVPWRRSIHWNSIRFATALAQRWSGFSLEQYKILLLGFKTWLALQYSRLSHQEVVVEQDCATVQVEMLQRIGQRSRKLLALNGTLEKVITFVTTKCQPIQRRIDDFYPQILKQRMLRERLPSKIDIRAISGKFALPAAEILQSLKAGSNVEINFLKEEFSSIVNPAEFVPSINPSTAFALLKSTIHEMEQALAMITKQKPELAMFTTCLMLQGAESFIYHLFNLVRTQHVDGDLDAWASNLQSLSDAYAVLVTKAKKTSAERRSREVLAVWSLTALVDCIARVRWPDLFIDIGVALPVDLLESLTFRDRFLMETTAALIERKRLLGSEGLFDHKCPAKTQTFAQKYFDSNEDMKSLLAIEREKERKRKIERQAKLDQVHQQYSTLQAEPCKCEKDKKQRVTKYCERCAELNRLLQTSTQVVNPLPASDELAKQVMFFTTQPPIIIAYASVITNAYKLHPSERTASFLTTIDCVDWALENGLQLKKHSSKVSLLSTRKPLATDSHFKKHSTFKVDIVYPDFSAMVSLGGSSLDAFKFDVAKYQYQLRGPLANLPWMADANHTENKVLAAQHEMPATMTKSEFISFGRVRAAPNLQIRELIMALKSLSDKQINNGDFLTLTQRVLYEMGPTSPEASCKWLWKRDLLDEDWLTELYQVLLAKLSTTHQNWESHATLRLIIEISTFVAQFGLRQEFNDLLIKARAVITEWIKEVEELIREFITRPELVLKWRLLLVQFYSYLLLASFEVTGQYLSYRSALARQKNVVGSNLTADIESLLMTVDTHAFDNTGRIHELLSRDPAMLYHLVKDGLNVRQEDLSWKRTAREDGRFTDWYSSGPHSVNPISGLILRDGFTVSELPSIIVQSQQYQEVMKNTNFIVQRVDHEYVSLPFGQRTFKFGFWKSSEQFPFIQEQYEDGRKLTLLPRSFLLRSGLPTTLVSEMAHWIDFDNGVIEFRLSDFRRTDFSYWMKLDSGECYINDKGKRSQLLNAKDERLAGLIKVLARIDKVENIQCTRSSQTECRVTYLNFNLSFTIKESGEIISDNYPGYKLADIQVVPTFPLFSKYLFIQPSNVHSTKLPIILISGEDQIYPYEYDEVHQRLIPSITLARLVLANIYAKHSYTMDPLTQTTGLQQAFDLLRRCWQNTSFSVAELKVMKDLLEFKEYSPTVYSVKLLVYHLYSESRRLLFLTPQCEENILETDEKDFATLAKKYFKTKHLLPIGTTLDETIERGLKKYMVPKSYSLGSYFTNVPKIFFSKETLPSSFTIRRFFTREVTVAPFVGKLPSEWQALGHADIEQLFFWFIKQLDHKSPDELLTYLTFLVHNTLLKDASGLMLLQCIFCTITTPNFVRPDSRLLESSPVHCYGIVNEEDVRRLIPRDDTSQNKETAWQIYASNYLDENYCPSSLFEESEDFFRSFNVTWRSNFLKRLKTLHNTRFLGRLFWDYSNKLTNPVNIKASSIAFKEAVSFNSSQQLTFTWPSIDSNVMHLELEPLNKFNNGVEFFEQRLASCYEVAESASKPSVDINALRMEESTISEQLSLIAKDRTKVAERRALNDRLDEIQELLNVYEGETKPVDFPLQIQSIEGSTEIHSKIVNELKNSYQKHIYSQQPTPTVDKNLNNYINLKNEVVDKRNRTWSEIVRVLTSIDLPLLNLWRMTNLLSRPHPRIIPLLLRSSEKCHAINPCLEDVNILHELAIRFALLQVHVLKLARIIELLSDLQLLTDASDRQGFESQLFSELSDKREWSPRQHPEWLIFEMERRVCIRSIQVEIATKMLEEKNIVLQLNMGEGKSKVIVPILCSVLTNGQTLVRVNVLASLFHEVHSYLKLALGNMLGKRIYTFPFHRNAPLTSNAMKELRRQLNECKLVGGIILTTPEHRESLELKYREVLWQMAQAKFNSSLSDNDFKGVIDVPILELLDESDEILRHKYQLIYTLGDQQQIEGGRSRWNVHLALVRCIFMANLYQTNREAVPVEYLDNNLDGTLRLQSLYQVMTLFKADFYCNPSHESQVLPAVRLINDSFYEQLRQALFKVFQLDPVWRLIAKGRSPDELKQIEEFVLNNYSNTIDGDKKCIATKNKLLQDKSIKVPVLALRGLLSFDVLKASLMKRHRIHYGVDKRRAIAMAVPFRGKDTPADGVEFGQPDMAITLTILAHSTGIDSDAVKSCFVNLKTKGINEQREIYRRWYVISKPIMNSKYVTLLEKIEAVNVENVNMMEHLTLYFSRNYEVIAYYLNKFVLPKGTRLFPEKIIANSWDLAKSSDKVVGFSGTDDTKHTLPLYVRQVALSSVESTNGKMIEVLTNEKFNNRQYKSLPKEFESERILQEMCSHNSWNVLIDSGALIEGMSNREVVVKVLEICPRFETGIFFDESNRLALIDRHGNSSQLNSSRPLEHSCFTYLDDIHTRGTDLPFPTKSHAFVTVATGITKDKLMQACMRMRKLVVGLHNVTFWGTSEVTMKIQQMVQTRESEVVSENAITSVHILEWVIENTIKAQEEAIITFASQGFHHYASSEALKLLRQNSFVTPGDIINAVALKDILDIEEMYGIPLKSVNMKDHINQHGTRTKGELLAREIDLNLSEIARPLYDNLIQHSCQLVPERKTVRVCGSVNEEYERELQQEVEEERHRHLPANALPCSEDIWDFAQINHQQFMSRALSGAIRVLQVLPLKSVFCDASLHTEWNESRVFARNDAVCNIFVTKNFVSTVQSNALSDYIRPIDVVIKFNGAKTQYLLVSLFEANAIINYVNPMPAHVEFHHLRYMHGTNNDEHRCITLLKLLNGNLSYSKQEKTALTMLLSVVPERMDFIDQAIAGIELSPELWHETWNALCRTTVLDKHNGFVEEREDLVPPSGPHNASMIRLITTVLNHSRLFSSKPSKFLHTLLTLRDTIRDYNYSDLHSLFGNL